MIKIIFFPLWFLQFVVNAIFLIVLGAILIIAGKSSLKNKISSLIGHWFVGADQYLNALFNGSPDETISSRAGKCVIKGDKYWCKILCKFLHLVDSNHCSRHIEYDEGKPVPSIMDNNK